MRRVRFLELGSLFAILILAALLRLFFLSRNGICSPYFAATALSMSQDGKLFFFNSFDPGGFVSVDKPPFAYWMTALSARVFGFSSLSQLVPQALAGLATILVLWRSVRRSNGILAGLLTAYFLAITPIAVAVDRSNMVDSWLTLFLTLAVCSAGRERFVASGGYVGLAFLTKLLAGLFVLPALFLAWLVGKRNWVQLALATLVLVGVSASWPLAVDLTPKDARPYVGGSKDNSVRDLILGYNGLGRVLGRADQTSAPEMKLPPLIYGGTPGPGRLFEPRLGDGWAWFLPLALLGVARLYRTRRWRSLALWGGWLGVVGVLFSFAKGTFHVHYLAALTPPAAALAGIGAAWGVRVVRRGGIAPLLGAVATLGAVVWQSLVLARGASLLWGGWLAPTLWLSGTIAVVGLLLAWLRESRPARLFGLLSVAALSIPPIAWCAVTSSVATVSMAPFAGPRLLEPRETLGIDQRFSEKFVRFLAANRRGAKYLVAVGSARQASNLILATRQAVMCTGGFLSVDPILTPDALADYAKRGEVRYVLWDADLQPALGEWIQVHGKPVAPSEYRTGEPNCQDSFYGLWDVSGN